MPALADAIMIELQGVSKRYRTIQALRDLTVSVGPGAIGLLGPNGAGKSTLIKALLGLVRLTSGLASVLGFDVRRRSRSIRQQVGYMPEDECFIAGLSAVESVAYAGELAGIPPVVALRRAHEMLDFVTMDEERYREVQTFSTGMKQKVKLAQALIHAPKIVFLDEPTNGLDPDARETMLRLIRTLTEKKGVSVVISTHILHDVEACCDSVVILGRGRLLVYDRIANLQKSVDNSLLVRAGGEAASLIRALEGRRCSVERLASDEIRVRGDHPDLAMAVLQSAKESSVPIRKLEPSRNSLEEIFVRAVEGV